MGLPTWQRPKTYWQGNKGGAAEKKHLKAVERPVSLASRPRLSRRPEEGAKEAELRGSHQETPKPLHSC